MLNKAELKYLYFLLRAIEEDQIVNPIEEWELDIFDDELINKKLVKNIKEKIRKLLSQEEINEIDKNILRRKYHSYVAEVDEEVYSKIEKAFNQRRIIEIEYFSMARGEATKRKIEIYYKSRRYIIAFCHLRNDIRKFRTARIIKAKLTKEKYTIPESFDKREYL